MAKPTSGPFEKTSNWLDWYTAPSKPAFKLPPGSVDAHCHVFGPGARFPYAPERKYTPCDASKEELYALRDYLGFARNVIVQATCHGADNRAMVDALVHSGGKARGIATVTRDITDTDLRQLHAFGVRGVRFNFVKRLVDFTPREALNEIAARIAELGWHVVIYFEAQDLPELSDFFTALPTTVVVDHMGRPDVSKPVDGPEFERFVVFMRDHPHVWCKVTCPERLSVSGPRALDSERNAYRDVVPFAKRIVEAFADRVLWGTDWPHPNLRDHMPDDGLLVDFIPQIAGTADLRRKLLVDNPMRLYWPEEELGVARPTSWSDPSHACDRLRNTGGAMVGTTAKEPSIPGTTIFDGEQARKGYALNKMCFSFNSATNRADFMRDQDAYCARFGLNDEQREAVRSLNMLKMIAAGGNPYFLAKLGGIFGLDMQDIGAQQTGMSKEAFKAKLVEAGRQ